MLNFCFFTLIKHFQPIGTPSYSSQMLLAYWYIFLHSLSSSAMEFHELRAKDCIKIPPANLLADGKKLIIFHCSMGSAPNARIFSVNPFLCEVGEEFAGALESGDTGLRVALLDGADTCVLPLRVVFRFERFLFPRGFF